jgi:hypothetical protein
MSTPAQDGSLPASSFDAAAPMALTSVRLHEAAEWTYWAASTPSRRRGRDEHEPVHMMLRMGPTAGGRRVPIM